MSLWIVQLHPEARTLWESRVASVSPKHLSHLGEETHLYEMAHSAALAELWASVLPRFVMRVDDQCSLDIAAVGPVQASAHMVDAVARWNVQTPCDVFGLKPWLRRVTNAAREASRPIAAAAIPDVGPTRWAVAIGDSGAYFGEYRAIAPLGDTARLDAPFQLPKREGRDTRVSRAARKFLEASHSFRRFDIDTRRVRHWIEYGAAPGGITRELLDLGARVTAVDKAPLDERVAKHERLTFHRGDALSVDPGRGPWDGFLSDLNAPPRDVLTVLTTIAPRLLPGSPVMVTIKLGRWETIWDDLRLANATCESIGIRPLEARHLPHNRQEVTLFATVGL